MGVLADETGGRLAFNQNDLGPELDRVRRDMASYYSLAYAPPPSAAGSEHRIEVSLGDRALQARYRRGYRAKDPGQRLQELLEGALYVAEISRVLRFDAIEDHLTDVPKPVVVYDQLPQDGHHGWKFIRFGPDGLLYVPVGAPCNICDRGDPYNTIWRMKPDGTGMEIFARGVRNTVGFDFHPGTKQLWFTDNQRDWLSEDMPLDELNVVKSPGKGHFGYPFCHSGIMTDPEFGWGKSCADYVKPAATLGPHAAPLGMKFYTGKSFPAKYRGAILIARHGPWNRTKKYADVAVAYLDANSRVKSVEAFVTGWVQDNKYLGRPVDIHQQPDGSILVSDDHNGAIYRVSYGR